MNVLMATVILMLASGQYQHWDLFSPFLSPDVLHNGNWQLERLHPWKWAVVRMWPEKNQKPWARVGPSSGALI